MYKTLVQSPLHEKNIVPTKPEKETKPEKVYKPIIYTPSLNVNTKKEKSKKKCFGLFSNDKNNCSLWLLVIPIIFVLVFVFVGPLYHGCTDKNNCTTYKNYGIYCDTYCVYGHSGPGTASAGILFFFTFFLIIFCFFGSFGGDCYGQPYYSPYQYNPYYYRKTYYTDKIVDMSNP